MFITSVPSLKLLNDFRTLSVHYRGPKLRSGSNSLSLCEFVLVLPVDPKLS